MAMGPCLALVVIFTMMSGGVASLTGAPECPCVSPSSPLIQQAKEQFAALGVPGYGMAGECRAYDLGLALSGCDNLDTNLEEQCKPSANVTALPSKCYCLQKWCFVDSEKCPINKVKCVAAGGTVGSSVSPHCRDREMRATTKTNATATAHFSYATCGALDYYTSHITSIVAGRELKVKIKDSFYWTMKEGNDKTDTQWQGWTGALTKALEESFRNSFESDVRVAVDEGWVSETSKEQFPNSSWTACVLDVAVGNADMCIGDFWVTPQRMNLANFLTPFDNDNFFLVAPRASTQETLSEILKKPFLPFHGSLWLVIVGFLVFSAFAMAVTDGHNTVDYHHRGRVPVTIKALYFAFAGYVKGGAANSPLSVPGRLANIGFGFFVLITLASYTANLTTVLVSRGSVSGINSVQDAIDKGLSICVPSVVKDQLKASIPNAIIVPVNDTGSIPRSLYKGICGAAIMQENAITMMHAGEYSKYDCAKAPGGPNLTHSLTQTDKDGRVHGGVSADGDEEWGCVRDKLGLAKADRDCYLARAGGLIMSIPLSVPVRADLVQSLSWALRKTVHGGKLNELKETFSKKLPPPKCGVDGSLQDAAKEDPVERLRLHPASMVGTTIISIGIIVIALLLAVVEIRTGRNIQELLGFDKHSDPDIPLDGKGQEQERRVWQRRSLGSKRNLAEAGGDPENFKRLASQSMELHTHKLNEIHRMLAKLSGEDMAVEWKPDDVPMGNQIMPFGPSTGSFKRLRPLYPVPAENSASISGTLRSLQGTQGMPRGPSTGSSRTLRTVSVANSSNALAHDSEECVA